MALLLSGRKCLVTGASSGIGKATCQVLTRYGAQVVGSGRSQEVLLALKKEGLIIDFVVADVTRDGECARLVSKAAELLGGHLTTVINAAGGLKGGAVGDADLENYHYNMRLNTQAPFEIIHHAVPFLKDQENASIVTVSSVNGKQSFPGCASYCMSKAAVDQLTRCASLDLANYGIRVNAVNPGVIKTNLHRVRLLFCHKTVDVAICDARCFLVEDCVLADTNTPLLLFLVTHTCTGIWHVRRSLPSLFTAFD